nr:hypothetical protein [Streptomyces sp. RPA4-2]QIY61322.1 hypothetical protein HEP85_06100 [Streptomyces sp. RPA4-2]
MSRGTGHGERFADEGSAPWPGGPGGWLDRLVAGPRRDDDEKDEPGDETDGHRDRLPDDREDQRRDGRGDRRRDDRQDRRRDGPGDRHGDTRRGQPPGGCPNQLSGSHRDQLLDGPGPREQLPGGQWTERAEARARA